MIFFLEFLYCRDVLSQFFQIVFRIITAHFLLVAGLSHFLSLLAVFLLEISFLLLDAFQSFESKFQEILVILMRYRFLHPHDPQVAVQVQDIAEASPVVIICRLQ
jgi:uncharacterized membrane protein YdfJ with MMPL/SSD domain